EGIRLRLPEADPELRRRDHRGVRAHSADREAEGVRGRARRIPRPQEGRRMKIFNFHLMPYRHADLDAIEKNGSAWVTYSNSHYDPDKGAGLYHEYLDQMELAD